MSDRTTHIATRVMGLSTPSTTAKAATACVACGTPIARGAPSAEFVPSSGFMDGRILLHHLRQGANACLCEHCAPTFPKRVMDRVKHSIVTEEGVFPLMSKGSRAWFILNPPKPPFAVAFATTQGQHLLWRTPVTLDADYWLVQLGARTVPMDRLRVLQARDACTCIEAKFLAETGKRARTPFIDLSRDVKGMNVGVLRPDMVSFAQASGLEREIALLRALGPGELWGLFPLVFAAGEAAKPPTVSLEDRGGDDDGEEQESE